MATMNSAWPKARTEAEMLRQVLDFAREHPSVRAVTLEGSRTNVNIPRDDFQDYDITFLVTNMEAFTTIRHWL